MIEKLLLSSDFLKTVTAIDPVAILAKRTDILKATYICQIQSQMFCHLQTLKIMKRNVKKPWQIQHDHQHLLKRSSLELILGALNLKINILY